VTPMPAFSEQVYRVIQPSLVLVQADVSGTSSFSGTSGTVEQHLGSGVVINDQGDILTALHVVTQTDNIQVTFADGTQSSETITTAQPEDDIAVLRADKRPPKIVPVTLRTPNANTIG